jgi:hypothetical protein
MEVFRSMFLKSVISYHSRNSQLRHECEKYFSAKNVDEKLYKSQFASFMNIDLTSLDWNSAHNLEKIIELLQKRVSSVEARDL